MDENPPRVSRKGGTQEARDGPQGKSRHSRAEDSGDPIECSGKHCRSCTGGAVADCVALCCCPCALLNLLALAFVKVPWMVGRRCLGRGKRKGKKRKCRKSEGDVVEEREWSFGSERIEEGIVEVEQMGRVSAARFEAESVWLELNEVGHLGFGRVSFTGIQSLGKGN